MTEEAETKTSKRGLAGRSHEERKETARLGGLAVSKDLDHMKEIGSKGGKIIALNKEHMSRIGRLGGLAKKKKAKES